MTIKVTDNRKICDIQNEFNEKFPFLKLEFFALISEKGEKGEKIRQIEISRKLGEAGRGIKKGEIKIHPKLTVCELESAFREKFGILVQVFRKSGKMWLQSTVTDSWTLKEQNEHGEALSNFKS